MSKSNRLLMFLPACFLLLLFAARTVETNSAENPPPFRFGISTALHDDQSALDLGYDWIQVFDAPTQRYDSQVLLRVDPDQWNGFSLASGAYYAARNYGNNIDAYQLGNEPNGGAENLGWRYASDYVDEVCTAAQYIRSFDPTATIVAAALAPVGRISGISNGHFGHDGVRQDERIYLDEMLAANVHQCVDAIAYHPQGFSADFNATPDVDGGTPETNCANGFCFRGIEKFYEVLEARQLGHIQVWATEVGWLREPPANCLSDSSWNGRAWQIVSAEKQYWNVIGAVDYAEANYPWLDALFVWNLDFEDALYYDDCEQMRYYSIDKDVNPQYKMYLPIVRR